MALKKEVANALEQIAAVCGWETLDFIWSDTYGFRSPDTANILYEAGVRSSGLMGSFKLLKEYREVKGSVSNFIARRMLESEGDRYTPTGI